MNKYALLALSLSVTECHDNCSGDIMYVTEASDGFVKMLSICHIVVYSQLPVKSLMLTMCTKCLMYVDNGQNEDSQVIAR